MTSKQIREFFMNFGIVQGVEYKAISLDRLSFIVKLARRWYNVDFARFVMDCFKPVLYDPSGIPTKFAADLPKKDWFDSFDRNHPVKKVIYE